MCATTPRAAATRDSRRSTFFRYVAITEPAHTLHCQRVLAIPSKRFDRGLVELLNDKEIDALLDAPDSTTWIGRRDRAFLLVAVQTGLRVSELTTFAGKTSCSAPVPISVATEGAQAPLHATTP